MTRPSVLLSRVETNVAAAAGTAIETLRRRPEVAFEIALMAGIVVEIWIGVLRTAALYHGGP